MIVYLTGSYMRNDNFGDVQQAEYWVKKYTREGYELVVACSADGIASLHRNFPDVKLITEAELKGIIQVPGANTLVHMYGGGYLNKLWGQTHLELMSACAKADKCKLIITGVQADATFANQYFSRFREHPSNFRWISCRDSMTAELMKIPQALICDDFIGSLLDYHPRLKNNLLPRIHKSALVQLSLNQYVHGQDEARQPLIAEFYKGLLEKISSRYQVTLFTSFGQDREKIIEAERLYDTLAIDTRMKFGSVTEFYRHPQRYDFVIVNSFHTYLLARYTLDCPVYFIVLSNYYQQKASALVEYGLLDPQHVITRNNNPESLNFRLKGNVATIKENFLRLKETFKEVERMVDKIVF